MRHSQHFGSLILPNLFRIAFRKQNEFILPSSHLNSFLDFRFGKCEDELDRKILILNNLKI
jgi:hypothetical protein